MVFRGTGPDAGEIPPVYERLASGSYENVKTYPLEDFAFRYLDRHEREIFSGSRKSGWEEVKIPDYRGPAGENGKWRGCYRCGFFSPEEGRELRAKGRRAVLAFQCVD